MNERVLAEISGFEPDSVLCYLLFNCIVRLQAVRRASQLGLTPRFAASLPVPGEPGTPNLLDKASAVTRPSPPLRAP
jgi:hypothetical protein